MAESLTTPAILPQTIAENGDATVIPATNDQTEGKASIAYGFPPLTSTPIADGGKMVRRADFNGLFNLLSQYALFAQNGGLFTFDANVSAAIGGYPLGARLVYTDSDGKSHIVRSLIPNNTYNFNTDPTYIDGLKWGYTFVDFDANNVFTDSQTIKKNDDYAVMKIIKSNVATNNTIPATNSMGDFRVVAADDSLIGHIYGVITDGGTCEASLQARRTIGGVDKNCNITAIVKSDGTVSTFAPTPASTSRDSSIANTKWVSDLLRGNLNASNGWTYLGNGIVLQWIHVTATSGTNSSGTLPIAFDSNSVYRVVGCIASYSLSSQTNGYISTYNYTTTGFKFNSSQNGAVDFFIIGRATSALSALTDPKPL